MPRQALIDHHRPRKPGCTRSQAGRVRHSTPVAIQVHGKDLAQKHSLTAHQQGQFSSALRTSTLKTFLHSLH
jgi:hypothetical protein